MTYPAFGKIPRWNRGIVVTEKIDGTNGQVRIALMGDDDGKEWPEPIAVTTVVDSSTAYGIWAGSRNRWLTLEQDNFGFAKWVHDNAATLCDTLGEGSHYGEWWGQGIQRRYGLTEKRFSLFNTGRWAEPEVTHVPGLHVVPELWRGNLIEFNQNEVLSELRSLGSQAAPGFDRPEGIIIYHEAARHSFKVTLVDDQNHKELNLNLDVNRHNEPVNGVF